VGLALSVPLSLAAVVRVLRNTCSNNAMRKHRQSIPGQIEKTRIVYSGVCSKFCSLQRSSRSSRIPFNSLLNGVSTEKLHTERRSSTEVDSTTQSGNPLLRLRFLSLLTLQSPSHTDIPLSLSLSVSLSFSLAHARLSRCTFLTTLPHYPLILSIDYYQLPFLLISYINISPSSALLPPSPLASFPSIQQVSAHNVR